MEFTKTKESKSEEAGEMRERLRFVLEACVETVGSQIVLMADELRGDCLASRIFQELLREGVQCI